MANCRSILMAIVCAGWALTAACAGTPDDKPPKAADEQVLFGDLPAIEAAAPHAQTRAGVPAAVSVTTIADG
jgi:hypothetical protein